MFQFYPLWSFQTLDDHAKVMTGLVWCSHQCNESGLDSISEITLEAFTEFLDKYQDFDRSPATESLEKIIAKFEQPWTTYYYIVENDIVVGAVRIVNKNDGSRKRISPIWIMGEFRNKGYAQQAIIELENIYGSDHWCLDTILQEKANLHLYEKMGYVQTGQVEHVNEKMDIVFYEKTVGKLS